MITSRWMTYGKGWIIDKTLLYSRIQTVIGQAVKKIHSLREDLEPLLTELAAGETQGIDYRLRAPFYTKPE